MYRIELGVEIAASVARVWRALCDPAEVVLWDTGVVEAIDAPPDYPQPGQHVRWRYRSGLFRVLHDRPQGVIPRRRLRSLLDLGPYHLDETYTLWDAYPGCRLDLALDVEVRLPLIGRRLERLSVDPVNLRGVSESLGALKRYCEATSTE